MFLMLFKSVLVWAGILVLAIANAAVRELVFSPWLGASVALPLSGLTLALLVWVVAWLSVPLFGAGNERVLMGVGVLWLVMTLGFDLGFGYFVSGRSWQEVLQVFDVSQGNLFTVVLLVTLVAPWLAGRLRVRGTG
ncbi:hypothetical protein QQM79_14380 [Marinobacteraceae bacterium S3BR75-40.1]